MDDIYLYSFVYSFLSFLIFDDLISKRQFDIFQIESLSKTATERQKKMLLTDLKLLILLLMFSLSQSIIVEIYLSDAFEKNVIHVENDRRKNSIYLPLQMQNQINETKQKFTKSNRNMSTSNIPNLQIKINEKNQIFNFYEVYETYFIVKELSEVPQRHWNGNCIFITEVGKTIPKTNCQVCIKKYEQSIEHIIQKCLKNNEKLIQKKEDREEVNLVMSFLKCTFGGIILLVFFGIKENNLQFELCLPAKKIPLNNIYKYFQNQKYKTSILLFLHIDALKCDIFLQIIQRSFGLMCELEGQRKRQKIEQNVDKERQQKFNWQDELKGQDQEFLNEKTNYIQQYKILLNLEQFLYSKLQFNEEYHQYKAKQQRRTLKYVFCFRNYSCILLIFPHFDLRNLRKPIFWRKRLNLNFLELSWFQTLYLESSQPNMLLYGLNWRKQFYLYNLIYMNLYCLETGAGKIQLSKGAYLTMLKKKLPTVKTLTKHKPINSHYHEKNTVKKPLVKSLGRSITKNMRKNEIMMQDCNNRQHIFELNGDRDIFESRIVLPSIPMDCDNDTQSEWGDIDANVKSLALQLSLATFDSQFDR